MTAATSPSPSALTVNALCLLSMVTWAVGLPALGYLVQVIPPMTLTAFRVGLAGLVLVIAWALWEGAGPVLRAPWKRGIGVGFVVMGVGAVLVAVALERTDPVTVAIITAMMPVIGIALECFLDGRRLTLALALGLILSLAGGLVALDLGAARPGLGLGALAAFGSVFAFTWGSRATVTAFPTLRRWGVQPSQWPVRGSACRCWRSAMPGPAAPPWTGPASARRKWARLSQRRSGRLPSARRCGSFLSVCWASV
jgi:drug/metabolite transporter (DMT)-like permease